MLIILIALSLVGIEAIRHERRASVIADYRYRLFEMRDRLRAVATRDCATQRSWLFAYLDSTTAKAISRLPMLSVWRLLALALVYENDKSYQILTANLERELAKPQFRELKEYEHELTSTLLGFLVERHKTFDLTIELVDRAISPAQEAVAKYRKRSLDAAIKSPEMSTLPEHDPEFAGMAACPVPV